MAPVSREDLYARVLGSQVFTQWHWFRWHFEHYLREKREHPLTRSIVDACLRCEDKLPGFAVEFIDRMATISGREKHPSDWEQLLQSLAELLVIDQALGHPWPSAPTFAWEPVSGTSKKNPELEVATGTWRLGIEVKAPALFKHMYERAKNGLQLLSRIPPEVIPQLAAQVAGVTYPRDNPVKDFLLSADSKFASFKASDARYIGLLVIVWDDFINEPISALAQPDSGLFTDNSFAKDPAGSPLRFANVDGVVIVRHLHQLVHACSGQPFEDQCRHALDYGREREFPFKAYVANPNAATAVPEEVLDCFQALPPHPMMGAEYVPSEVVWWF
jgi:hypothetical protein